LADTVEHPLRAEEIENASLLQPALQPFGDRVDINAGGRCFHCAQGCGDAVDSLAGFAERGDYLVGQSCDGIGDAEGRTNRAAVGLPVGGEFGSQRVQI
jgi:hypothetical protein